MSVPELGSLEFFAIFEQMPTVESLKIKDYRGIVEEYEQIC